MPKKKNKSKGLNLIPFYETRSGVKKKIREIKNKQWPDVSSLDVYRLFEFGWTTTEITSHFNVRHYQVLNRLRKF
ncbi:MAG: hypothetical protein CL521_06125 [Actinobacteria bacterium]|nr:hypothetical protein [Actinomycetota bacterium]